MVKKKPKPNTNNETKNQEQQMHLRSNPAWADHFKSDKKMSWSITTSVTLSIWSTQSVSCSSQHMRNSRQALHPPKYKKLWAQASETAILRQTEIHAFVQEAVEPWNSLPWDAKSLCDHKGDWRHPCKTQFINTYYTGNPWADKWSLENLVGEI